VDLPIQRERATGLPTIHGSGIKGSLRDTASRHLGVDVVKELFGSEPPSGPGNDALEPGGLIFSDARLVLLPCRTAGPAFAWVTSPMILARLGRDAQEAGLKVPEALPATLDGEVALVAEETGHQAAEVFVEEFRFTKKSDPRVTGWAKFFQQHLLPADPA